MNSEQMHRTLVIKCRPTRRFPQDYQESHINTFVSGIGALKPIVPIVFFHETSHSPPTLLKYKGKTDVFYFTGRNVATLKTWFPHSTFVTIPDNAFVDPNGLKHVFKQRDAVRDALGETVMTSSLAEFMDSQRPIFLDATDRFSFPRLYKSIPKPFLTTYTGIKEQNFDQNKSNVIVQVQGGYGNILFMLLCGMTLATKHNRNLLVNYNYRSALHVLDYTSFKFLNYIDLNYKYISDLDPNIVHVHEEHNTGYNPIQLDQRDVILSGFFQSYKYFDKASSFSLRQQIIENNLDASIAAHMYIATTGSSNKVPTMLHIRRGDYLSCSSVFVNLAETEYYKKALAILNKDKCKVFVFSDDIPFAKTFLTGVADPALELHFVDDANTESSFIKMAHCTHFIIANSTFSLSSYFLRTTTSGSLIAPGAWFVDESKTQIHDLYPEGTIVIE
jgi:hypothetical protein